jgi:hypothetical protein
LWVDDELDQIVLSLAGIVGRGLVDILVAAGHRGTHQEIFGRISTVFRDKVMTIIKASLHLSKVLGEEIISSDLEVVVPRPGVDFDAATMDDIGREHGVGVQKVDRVLCATELGLRRVVKRKKENQNCLDTTLLLKPKCALESVVENMSRHEGLKRY